MTAAGISTDQARAFLEAYASDFQRQDKDAVADRYAYPAHVVTHDGGVALVPAPTREAWLAVIERILKMYGVMGVRRAAMVDLSVVSVSPQIAQAHLIWDLHGDGDRPLYQFEATYTLALLNDGLKIVQVISENEQPKFMGVMRERG